MAVFKIALTWAVLPQIGAGMWEIETLESGTSSGLASVGASSDARGWATQAPAVTAGMTAPDEHIEALRQQLGALQDEAATPAACRPATSGSVIVSAWGGSSHYHAWHGLSDRAGLIS
jgi:hypothetical protein